VPYRHQPDPATDRAAAAGAHACFIISIVEVEGHPREPAVTCQAVRAKSCTLSADDIQCVVARMLIHNLDSIITWTR
jgi:hypothetical protein